MRGIPVVTLGTGCEPIPLVGLGTAAAPQAPPDVVRAAVLHAIRIGCRHFDTAAIYQTEQPVGEAIADALRQGLLRSRDEVFVTTKLWCSDSHRGLVLPALRNSLRNLGLDYVDLYLVHLPVSAKPGQYELPIRKEDLMTFDMASVWEGMEQCHKLGLAKAIGVSNFSCKKLELLLGMANIPPAVNQVEMNPLWQQTKLRELCAKKGVHVSAFSPLGGGGTPFSTGQVLRNSTLREIAEAKGKTTAQGKGSTLQRGWDPLFADDGERPGWDRRVEIDFGLAKLLHKNVLFDGDLKPQNVLLDADLTARISDLGVAKLFQKNQSRTNTGIRISGQRLRRRRRGHTDRPGSPASWASSWERTRTP